MAYKITEECINCGACVSECQNDAIYEPGIPWTIDGSTFSEGDTTPSGATGFFSEDHYYIVPDKCTECEGFFDEPQCVTNCPSEAVIKIQYSF